MTQFIQTSASRTLKNTVQDHYIAAEAPFSTVVKKGQILRIEDTFGQQAIDTYLRGLGFSLDGALAPRLSAPAPAMQA